MDYKRKKVRLGDVLVQNGVITEEDLQRGLERQKGSGRKLGETLVDEGITTEENIARALSKQFHYDMVDLQNTEIPQEILDLVPANVLKKHRAIPFEYSPDNMNVLRVAMSDPMDIGAMDDINIITNLQVEPVVATMGSVMLAIDRYYGQAEVNSALEEYTREKESQVIEQEDMYSEDVNNSPIVQLVKGMIDQAVRQRASDIHIEPMEKQVRIRYRIDGALYEKSVYSIRLLPAIVARVKIIGGMDISEKRKPQDGRITQIVDRKEFDIRVSILPTVYGEKIVMRLTSKNALTKEKSQLGLKPDELKKFDHILQHPHGILLVTGPTGSGKSTTLAAIIDKINNNRDAHVITLEDPIEYLHRNKKSIISQREIAIDTDNYLTGLRACLRQAPDVILLGEMRDAETIRTAMTAAETGHLVIATLHTKGAVNTIDRVVDSFPADQQDHGPGGGLGVDDADLLLRVLLQHHVTSHHGGVVGAGEVCGDGEAHRAVPGLKGLGKGRRRGARRGGRRLLRRHGCQQVRDDQLVIVDELPLPHLDAQGDGLKPDGAVLERRHSQITAAVTHNVPNHNILLIIWFCIPYFLLSYRTSTCLSMVK